MSSHYAMCKYDDATGSYIPLEVRPVADKLKKDDPLYQEGFQAGAASRDAEIHRLQMVLADTEALELGTAEKCDQLREQVSLLREALLTCSVGDFSTGHVIYPSFDEKLVEEALAATEPKQPNQPDTIAI